MDISQPACLQKAPAPIVAPIPRVSQAKWREIYSPQAPSNIMTHLKLSTPPMILSRAVGTSSKPISKPSSTVPVDIDPQRQAHADTLARFGIKVRDFAYESKLPPVRPYRVRQIQPGHPLKRVRRDVMDDDNIFYINPKSGAGEGSSSKKSKLEREATEPNIIIPTNNPMRARGFLDLNYYEPESQSQSLVSNSQQSEWETPQIPSRYLESEDSEPYIDTPLVTPNGSLQWKVDNTSDMPASQLDTDTEANEPELLSYSQLGMPSPIDTTGTGLYGALTPMSSLSSISSNPPPPSSSDQDSHHEPVQTSKGGSPERVSARQPRLSNKLPNSFRSTTGQLPAASRYSLRKRLGPSSPGSPTKPDTRGRHTVYSSLSSHLPFSHQRKSKPQISPVSPHLRKRTAVPGGRDDAMVVR